MNGINYQIGEWVAEPERCLLGKAGNEVHLPPQTMNVLVYMALRANEVVSIQEMLASLWPQSVTGDYALYNAVSALRKAFNEDSKKPAYIKTVPKRGYQLIAPVSQIVSDGDQALPSPRDDPRATGNVTDAKSIAILPLVNRSDDPANEYLCDGIAEELIGGLSNIKGLKVASQLSSFAFKHQDLDVASMGEQLNVDHILSGSVQKADHRVRISVILNRVSDDTSLWSQHYDRKLEDIFELQEDVARQVIDALQIELGANHPPQLLDLGTVSPKAYTEFLAGLNKARKGDASFLEQAVTHLKIAARLDPHYARVHWWLYFCYWRLIVAGRPRDEMEPKAEVALNNAKALGFVSPVPWIKARRDLYPETRPDQRTLVQEAAESIREINPDWRFYGYIQLGDCLVAAGLNHGACDYYEYYLIRVQHDLSATWIEWRYRALLQQLGRFEAAIAHCTKSIAAQPDDPGTIAARAVIYSRMGQYEKAASDLAGLRTSCFAQFNHLYWRRELSLAREFVRQHPFEEPLYQYWSCFLLGDIEQGLDHLEEDVSQGVHPAVFRSNLGQYLPQSIVQEIERHPRYKAILKQFEIDDQWRDELIGIANDLTHVTGIYVRLDESY